MTGITYSADLPVTPNGVQQAPAPGSTQSGFVERFSVDGRTLVYATYLTGAEGSTTPTAIAADANDNAYVAGSTTASGFPARRCKPFVCVGEEFLRFNPWNRHFFQSTLKMTYWHTYSG